jgi:DNA-binding protein HU-beta
VKLSKFGTFESVQAAAYTGRNPRTGEPIDVPAKKRIKFQAYTEFKKRTNGER